MDENNPDPDVTESEDPENAAGASETNDADEENEEGPPKPKPPKPKPRPDDPVSMGEKLKLFFGTHLTGVVAFLTPIIFLFVLAPFPPDKWQWCAYCLCIMAIYWVFECIPLPVTSFLPVIIFPLTGIMDTHIVCAQYMNDTIVMFLGSIMLAASVEQSGLHKRIALYAIKIIGYSHYKMLFAVAFVTMFISMWITNTAAATMMVPIVFALLRVYEGQKLYQTFEKNNIGDTQATPLTSCYFCCITYAATIGGIGTIVGTATNLVFIGLFVSTYPTAPEYVSFPLFSAFTIPTMIVMTLAMYLFLALYYMGMGRPSSPAAKKVQIPPAGLLLAKKAVETDIKKLGKITWHEVMVIILFGGAMLMFFSRSPQIFPGWADRIKDALDTKPKFIKDSATATLIIFLMTLLPAQSKFFKNFSAKYVEDLPKGPVPSVLDWNKMNLTLPYSFSFLLAGGFALSTAAKTDYSDLNGKIGEVLQKLVGLPNALVLLVVIFFTTFVTNFASNVAVCNVIAPIAMQLAVKLDVNPLWYCMAAGISASYCFMLPVGTPGNLIVQSAAKIPMKEMMIAGSGPTVTTVILTWLFLFVYAPIIWPSLHDFPDWISTVT